MKTKTLDMKQSEVQSKLDSLNANDPKRLALEIEKRALIIPQAQQTTTDIIREIITKDNAVSQEPKKKGRPKGSSNKTKESVAVPVTNYNLRNRKQTKLITSIIVFQFKKFIDFFYFS